MKGHQITSVKVSTGRDTSTDIELFAIRLAIAIAAVTGCRNIVVFTDNLPATRSTLHSGQDHSPRVSRLLRFHYTARLEGNLHFWAAPATQNGSYNLNYMTKQ